MIFHSLDLTAKAKAFWKGMSLCHAVLRGLGGKCVCVSPCHGGKEHKLVQTQRVMVTDRVDRGGQLGLL